MLQLALAALLAGSLIAGGPDDDKDKDKKAKADAQPPIESILVPHEEEDPINDTYSFGRNKEIPIKFWLGYGWGQIKDAYLADGEQFNESQSPGGNGEFGQITSQRAFVGAQLHVLNFTNFKVGVGGQLNAAKNDFDNVFFGVPNPTGGILGLRSNAASDFTLQNVKVYGLIRGNTLGIHGGYLFDLSDEGIELFDENLEAGEEAPVSDQVDAWFVGADFDYPAEHFRIFAGIDYFNRDELATGSTSGSIEDDEIVMFNAGLGVIISWVEIGAAALLKTNIAIDRFENPGGGHQGSIAPYLRLSPPSIPVSISVKGAVLDEYVDYGYSIGGAKDFVTTAGFTVTATLGF